MIRSKLLEQLSNYGSSNPEELLFVAQFNTLLQNPRCFYRDHLPGHITGSAWITNTYFTKVVLVQHAKLNKWLQPGGHADGEEQVEIVARKELGEETGLTQVKLKYESIFDIDIHSIPARESFPEHFHYDIRFLFIANEAESLKGNHESHEVKWVSLSEIRNFTQEKSILRMKEKLMHHNAIWN